MVEIAHDVKNIDFKSVGEKSSAQRVSDVNVGVPIGLKTPMQIGESNDGIFAMHFNLANQIRDNFRNLLLTNHGERVGVFDFGANLQPLSMELGSDILDEELATRIKTAAARFMPWIDLVELRRTLDNDNNQSVAKINLRVFYDVPNLGVKRDAVEVTLFIAA